MSIHVFDEVAARIRGAFSREEGAGLVEYALLVALIAILLVGALIFLRTGLENSFSDSARSVRDA